ncbi:MAG: hypothetical protein Tsb0019_38880 [Roseibium sp.]
MPWFLDTLYQASEVTWRIAPGQNLPENLNDPLSVPPDTLSHIQVEFVSNIEFVPDFVKGPVPRTIFVSTRFKELVEQLEPDRHRFIPLRLLNMQNGAKRTGFYFFKVGNITSNALIPEVSDVEPKFLKGALRRYSKTKLHPRLMWDERTVGSLHVWIDRYLPDCPLVSDRLFSAMANLGMCDHGLFRAIESRTLLR